MNLILAIVTVFGIGYGVASAENENKRQLKTLIGNDDRQAYSNKYDFPFTIIGVIDGISACTAYLIGIRHVLTSCHCLNSNATSSVFYPSYHNGIGYNYYNAFIVNKIFRGVQGQITKDSNGDLKFPPGYTISDDWAILILNEPIGQSLGYLKFTEFSISWINKQLFSMVTYQKKDLDDNLSDFPFYQPVCSVKEIKDDVLYHDCDINANGTIYSSGGPMLINIKNKGYFVVSTQTSGIGQKCSKYVKDKCANIAIRPTKTFLKTLNYAISNFSV